MKHMIVDTEPKVTANDDPGVCLVSYYDRFQCIEADLGPAICWHIVALQYAYLPSCQDVHAAEQCKGCHECC